MFFSKELFWSRLDIKIEEENDDLPDLIEEVFEEIYSFEMKYSRFIKWNFLYNLNKNKKALINREFFSILKLCLEVSRISGWFFDITVLPLLENMWYGIEKWKVDNSFWYKNVVLKEKEVILKNNVCIDIWSVWKWYMVDKTYNKLKKHCDSFVINFWWDIKIKWKERIFLEDPKNENKHIWSIDIKNMSISWSSSNKRRTKKWHHLIDMWEKTSKNDKLSVYVSHKLCAFSDIFATAIFVSPLEKWLEMIKKVDWLEALIICSNWDIIKSDSFNCDLNIKWKQ